MQQNNGLTIVELLVAAAVSLMIIGAAFAIAMSSRSLFLADQERTSTNQNLRSALDIVGNDARIVGERLGGESSVSIPAVEVKNGNELILRRSVIEVSLPICTTSGSLSTTIPIARTFIGQLLGFPGCNAVDSNSNGTPDNLEAWRTYRLANGGSVRAYIYNPATKNGEFFTYTGEATDLFSYYIRRTAGNFTFSYPAAEYPSTYLIEERRYRLRAGVLELIINEDTNAISKVVDGLTSFEVAAIQDGTRMTTFDRDDDWKEIDAIELTVVGAGGRTLSSQYFPRNTLSY